MKRIFFRSVFLFVFLIFSLEVFSQSLPSYSTQKANRRTALRCLSLAKDYASAGDWNSSFSQIQLGLSYDDSVSDLWYILALSKKERGDTKANVLVVLEKSLELNHWVDYNRDSARILYADILCDTGRYNDVLPVLDSKPFLYSSDAEYIRSKACYRIASESSVEKAREKIDSARKIYPDDKRFPLLFFTYENPYDESPLVKKLASFFIERISHYDVSSSDQNTELEIKAARFAEGEEQKRMLSSFKARGLKHPLYPALALKAGIESEESAFSILREFADSEIDYSVLAEFIPLLKDTEVLEEARLYWTSFGGKILQDTDGDLIENLSVEYYRGRPSKISFDFNQDGLLDWSLNCDFGVPFSGTVNEKSLFLEWDQYPYLAKASYQGENGENILSFTIVGESLSWSPVEIESDGIISLLGAEFFFPFVRSDAEEISDEMLLSSCSSYEIPSRERKGAVIRFTILDGKALLARYYQNDKMYAQAEFRNGFPEFRIVDADGDDVFETTEFYGFDKNNSMNVHCLEDEKSVMTNLFGLPAQGGGFYLRLVQIDRNGDTLADFTEEYLENNGKISSWDTDSDGLWDIRSVTYGSQADSSGKRINVVTDDMFYQGPQENLVTVTSIDGRPVRVISGEESLDVTSDPFYDFYWIGKAGDSETARYALELLASDHEMGECFVFEHGKERVFCVRVGERVYGELTGFLDDINPENGDKYSEDENE